MAEPFFHVQGFLDHYEYVQHPSAGGCYACLGAGLNGFVYVCKPRPDALGRVSLRNEDVKAVLRPAAGRFGGCLAVKHIFAPAPFRRTVASRESSRPLLAVGEYHNNLVRVVDVFEEDWGSGQWMISCIMELSPLAEPFPVHAVRGIAFDLRGPNHDHARHSVMVEGACSKASLSDNTIWKLPVTEAVAKSLMLQLLMGLAHLHHGGVVHRDVKPENILIFDGVSRRDPARPEQEILIPLCKLTDYGHARIRAGEMTAGRGTHAYMAPEMADTAYTEKVDVFAAGCTLYHVMCGQPPLRRIDYAWPNRFDALLLDMVFPVGTPIRAFLRRLTARSPQDRPSAAEARLDAWLADAIDPLDRVTPCIERA